MQSKQTQLSSIRCPKTHEKGGMTQTCVIPVYTQTRGKTMKKGKRSLYLQGRSSMSSANPKRIVPNIVVKMAICMVRFQGVDHRRNISVMIIPMTVNATAAEKPTHSGISFSPYLLPFLLISSPKIRFLCMKRDTFGMSAPVNIQPQTPEARISKAMVSSIWVRASIVETTARDVVSVN